MNLGIGKCLLLNRKFFVKYVGLLAVKDYNSITGHCGLVNGGKYGFYSWWKYHEK